MLNRLNDVQSSINSTRSTQTEIVKTMENMRRESVSQIEQTQVRIRQEMSDMNSQTMQRTTDKLDRLRDEFEYRIKDHEKVCKYFLGCFTVFKTIILNYVKNYSNRIIFLKMNNVNDNYKHFKLILNIKSIH